MLGKLFSSATSSRPASPNPSLLARQSGLESISSEERRAIALLFPGHSPWAASAQSSAQSSPYGKNGTPLSLAGFDVDSGELDLDPERDVRVVVAQDRGPYTAKTVILDTAPPSQPTPAKHASKSQDDSARPAPPPQLSRLSSFSMQRTRNRASWQEGGSSVGASALNGLEYTPGPYGSGTSPSGAPSKADEETRMITECMFGTTAMSYKGSSTKLHILPQTFGQRPDPAPSTPELSSRRSDTPVRSGSVHSPSKSISSSTDLKNDGSTTAAATNLLVTRMFSVMYPSDLTGAVQTPSTEAMEQQSGFPFPRSHTTSQPRAAKPTRAGMFAVGMIIRFPKTAKSQSKGDSSQRQNTWNSAKSSDWLSSSLNSGSFLNDPSTLR